MILKNLLFKNMRMQFPVFEKPLRGQRLAYLDSAATAQKPKIVLDTLMEHYQRSNSNVHRAVYYLSEIASHQFEKARVITQQFLNAREARECIFVKSTTEAINLVATSFGNAFVEPGDEILVSMMEHHSNLVPWQMLCQQKNAFLKFIPMNRQGELVLDTLDDLLTEKTKLVAISHASNALGTLHPIKTIIEAAHAKGIPVLVDGAQTAPHLPIDVQALDCDFFAFSGHKTYGPTGIGILYGKEDWLERMPPYQGGGEMIQKVSLQDSSYCELPHKFEAGTPAIAEAIAFGSALEFLMEMGLENVAKHEKNLLLSATKALSTLPDLEIIGSPKEKIGIISFTMKNAHPHDIGTIADQHGVALRSGHHCAMPLMDFFGLPGTARISFGLYNNDHDIEQLMEALQHVKHIFR